MGVRGLTTFIAKYEDQYKEKVFLRNCPVVIDGCNLMYFLYFDGPNAVIQRAGNERKSGSSTKKSLPNAYWFGGDWETYSQNIHYFFQQLKHCEIIPVVVMDGAFEVHKMNTVKSRFESSVRDNVIRGPFPGKTYTPVFLKTVFEEVLAEQKIPCFQTIGEADCTIAHIAHLLGDSYILSSDSDFFVYINSRAISLKSLRFAKATAPKSSALERRKKVWTLQGQYISIPRLCAEVFQMKDARLFQLAAVILGNDYLHAEVFKRFEALKANGNRQSGFERIESIMKWLGRMESVQAGIAELVPLVSESIREITIASINRIVRMYEGMDGEMRVWSAVKRSLDLANWISQEEVSFEDSCDRVNLPNWFIEAHINCELPKYLLNLYNNHLVIFSPQVEWFGGDSCHELSLSVISVTAGILFTDDASNFDVLTHIQGRVGFKSLCPVRKLPIYGNLPKLFVGTDFRKHLSYEKKLRIMTETLFGSDDDSRLYVQRLPASYRIWIACLLHYIKRKDGCVSTTASNVFGTFQQGEILAIAVSIFLCVFKNLLVNPPMQQKSKAKDENPNITLFQQGVSSEKLAKVRAFYQKFEDFGEVEGRKFWKKYEKKISYALAEYQCLVFHTEMLNSLLCKPYKSPKVRCTINNFFMYNLSQALMTTLLRTGAKVQELPAVFTAGFCKVEEMLPMMKDFVEVCMKLLTL